MRTLLSFVLVTVLLVSAAPSTPVHRFASLRGTVYDLAVTDRDQGVESTTHILVSSGPDGLLLVDSGVADWSPVIKKVIRGLEGQSVRFIINTHWHPDHTDGNRALASEATILEAAIDQARTALDDGLELEELLARGLPMDLVTGTGWRWRSNSLLRAAYRDARPPTR